MAAVREHAPGEVIARIAGRVVGEHEDDIRVGYAEALHGSIPALRRWHLKSGRSFMREKTHIPNVLAICYPESLFSGARYMQWTNGAYTVVEPIPRCADENCPIICV